MRSLDGKHIDVVVYDEGECPMPAVEPVIKSGKIVTFSTSDKAIELVEEYMGCASR